MTAALASGAAALAAVAVALLLYAGRPHGRHAQPRGSRGAGRHETAPALAVPVQPFLPQSPAAPASRQPWDTAADMPAITAFAPHAGSTA